MNGTIWIKREDGSEHDVTLAVQILYDALHGSLDFGSGFLDSLEIGQMRRIADLAGWAPLEYPYDVCGNCGHNRYRHAKSQCGTYDYTGKNRICDCTAFILREHDQEPAL